MQSYLPIKSLFLFSYTLGLLVSTFAQTNQDNTGAWVKWDEVKGDIPSPRTHSASVETTIDNHRQLLVHGGSCDWKFFDDLFLLNIDDQFLFGSKWIKQDTKDAPIGRSFHTANLLSKSQTMVVYGGMVTGSNQTKPILDSKVYLLDISSWQWKSLQLKHSAAPRYGHSTTLINDSGRMIVFGGVTEQGYSNDLFVIDTNTQDVFWPQISGSKLPKRTLHTSTVSNDILYIFGGVSEDGQYNNDMYSVNLNTWEVVQVKYSGDISPRAGMSSIVIENVWWMFGGDPKSNLQTFTLNGHTFSEAKNITADVPQQRSGSSIGIITAQSGIHVFGGSSSSKDACFNDVWSFHLLQ